MKNNLKKILIFIYKKLQYPSLLNGHPSHRKSLHAALKREHSELQNFTFFFGGGWIIVAQMDPDPDSADKNQCGSGSTILPTVKKAIELLDVPSRNTSLMLKKHNSNVEFFCLSTYVLFFPLFYRMKKFDIRAV